MSPLRQVVALHSVLDAVGSRGHLRVIGGYCNSEVMKWVEGNACSLEIESAAFHSDLNMSMYIWRL